MASININEEQTPFFLFQTAHELYFLRVLHTQRVVQIDIPICVCVQTDVEITLCALHKRYWLIFKARVMKHVGTDR